MWYKGLRIIEDALARLNADGMDFRMVFIGGGGDLEEVKAYADSCGITPKCIFTGPIHDRVLLRAWYCRGNLFLFPSTFDTNGLVVREAAACSLPSMLIAGSCAAEGITDGRNGFLIEENAESMYRCLKSLTREKMASVGLAAGLELERPASSGATDRQIAEAVQNGSLPESVLDQAVERILKVIFDYADHQQTDAVFDR